MNRERGLVTIVQGGGRGEMPPWLCMSEVRRCGLPPRSKVPGDSISKDIYRESIRQRKVMKYLRESCYHRIEYFIANFLTALMRKWYLRSSFQPYNYSQRFQKGADGTRMNTCCLIYTWRVETEGEDSIKWRKDPEDGDRKKRREKHCRLKNNICILSLKEINIRISLLG